MSRITLNIQPDAASGEDSYISKAAPTGNSGTAAVLYIRGSGTNDMNFLIRFPMTTLPYGATVVSATLKLYCTNHKVGEKLSVAPCKRAWTEGGVTWNTFNGSDAWQTAGGLGANDKDTDIITAQEPVVNSWNSFTIPNSLVNTWKYGTNNGLLFYYNTGGDNNTTENFSSSDNATVGNRPILEIVYDEAGGSFILNML